VNITPEQEYEALISWVSFLFSYKIQIVPGIREKELEELAEKHGGTEKGRGYP
jgi:hypothetical protein